MILQRRSHQARCQHSLRIKITDAGTCYSTVFDRLDSVKAASMFWVLATISGWCFCVNFYLRHYGAGMCAKSKNWSLFLLFKYWSKSAILKERVQNGCIKDHSIRKGVLWRAFTESAHNHEAQMVFYACKCFVFWSRRKDTWTESQA